MLKHHIMRYDLYVTEQAPPVIRGDGLGPKISDGKHPVGEVDMHGEQHQVVLKQVHVARPAIQPHKYTT